jgi:putative acetyltransferase
MIEFVDASAPPLLAVARDLFREYRAAIHVDLCFQGFERELASLPGAYAPPAGRLVVAMVDGTPAGCGALRPLGPASAELKRMWVRPAFRGRGLGRSIAEALLRAADDLGYRTVRLDTLDSMKEARSLYADLGFRELPAHDDDPLPGLIYMERARPCSVHDR